MTHRPAIGAAILLAVAVLSGHPAGQEPVQDDVRGQARAAAERAAARIRVLQQESDALVAQARTLLADLRKLEIDRALRAEELVQVEAELTETRAALADATERAETLTSMAEKQRPQVEARMVQLYKLGRAGYWRLLLDTDDVRKVGRAYRSAAAMLAIDRARVQAHAETLAALAAERKELETRERAIVSLRQRAAQARAAAEKAVAAHTSMLAAIDSQRDLNARMTGELEAARARLQNTVSNLASDAPAPVLPLAGFRGALPWPADGIVTQRFGRQGNRTGIEMSLAEGRAVRAVHEGTVGFAGPFAGFGQLVILEHGDGTHSLYGHLQSAGVKRGEHVTAGGQVGESGRNPGGNPALYFELRVDGTPVDPLQWLQRRP